MEKIYRAVVLLDREAYPLALEGRKREILLTDWILWIALFGYAVSAIIAVAWVAL